MYILAIDPVPDIIFMLQRILVYNVTPVLLTRKKSCINTLHRVAKVLIKTFNPVDYVNKIASREQPKNH